MNLRFEGMREFDEGLRELGGEFATAAAERAIGFALRIPAKEMRKRIPVRSGKGRKSIRYRLDKRTTSLASGSVGSWGRSAWYMRLVEHGTEPHRVPKEYTGRGRNRRRNKRVAVVNGRVRSAIQHPGFSGKQYIGDAFQATRQKTLDEFVQALHEQIVVQAFRKSRMTRT